MEKEPPLSKDVVASPAQTLRETPIYKVAHTQLLAVQKRPQSAASQWSQQREVQWINGPRRRLPCQFLNTARLVES
jgi:hypothetical protein